MKMRNMMLVALLAAGTAAAQDCPGDVDGSGEVTVDEIVRAVDAGLNGCVEPTEEARLRRLAGLSFDVTYSDSRIQATYTFRDTVEVSSVTGDPIIYGRNSETGRLMGAIALPDGWFRIVDLFRGFCFWSQVRFDGEKMYGMTQIYDAECAVPADRLTYALFGSLSD